MIVAITFCLGLVAIAVAVIPILVGMRLHANATSWSPESSPESNVPRKGEHDSLFDEIAKKELEEWRRLVA
jgi:hypothetical protein